jgi:hypothetical protein
MSAREEMPHVVSVRRQSNLGPRLIPAERPGPVEQRPAIGGREQPLGADVGRKMVGQLLDCVPRGLAIPPAPLPPIGKVYRQPSKLAMPVRSRSPAPPKTLAAQGFSRATTRCNSRKRRACVPSGAVRTTPPPRDQPGKLARERDRRPCTPPTGARPLGAPKGLLLVG